MKKDKPQEKSSSNSSMSNSKVQNQSGTSQNTRKANQQDTEVKKQAPSK